MMSREWLLRWLRASMRTVQQVPEEEQADLIDRLSERMTDDLMVRVLQGEASFWQHASQRAGLTPAQRMLRVQVSKFYENRLAALPSRQTPTFEEGKVSPEVDKKV